jgi:hypothetical protein
MSEAPEISSKPAPCRGRTKFPWLGMLHGSVTFKGESGEVVLPDKALVTVIKQMKDGLYVQPYDGPPVSGPVRVDQVQVDEVLGGLIERGLLGKLNVSWGSAGSWKLPYIATQNFILTDPDTVIVAGAEVRVPGEEIERDTARWEVFHEGNRAEIPKAKIRLQAGEDGSPIRIPLRGGRYAVDGVLAESHTIAGEQRAVSKGEPVAAEPAQRDGYYLVTKQGVTDEVAAAMLSPNTHLPLAGEPVELLCYEFGPYAAALAGLFPGFLAAGRASFTGGASEYWLGKLGGSLSDTEIVLDKLSSTRPERGDFVVFYNGDTSIHMAVATGDGQEIYSLWDRPKSYPVRVSIQDLWESEKTMPVSHVKIGKPRWHS